MGNLVNIEDLFLEKRIKNELIQALNVLNPDLSYDELFLMLLPRNEGNYNVIGYDYETKDIWPYAEYPDKKEALESARSANKSRLSELIDYRKHFGDKDSPKITSYFVFDSAGNRLK
ncbi:hypothetical protein C0585_03775 [Candidatus Woesearchaeota archaeon]|nr:MAG: hypothetical protein C0585_03775 [Candidatus Woesearchaeota archaeon]